MSQLQFQTPELTPQQLFQHLMAELKALQQNGVIEYMGPTKENELIEKLTNNFFALTKENRQALLNDNVSRQFAILAHFTPKFDDTSKLLEALSSPQNQLTLKHFATLKMTLDACMKLKRDNPAAEKLHADFLARLAKLEKNAAKKNEPTPLPKNPAFTDPLVAFFQACFGLDIRQTGAAAYTSVQMPLQSTSRFFLRQE